MDSAIDLPAGPCQTASERRSHRQYAIEFCSSMAAYLLLVNVSIAWIPRLDGIAKYAVAVSPVIGAVAITVAVIRYGLRMDEFQRRNIYNATAVCAIVTALVTILLGFLENTGMPRVSMIWVFAISTIAFGLALPYFQLRAR